LYTPIFSVADRRPVRVLYDAYNYASRSKQGEEKTRKVYAKQTEI